jgi:C4-dicarboxylate-specific signal transduction histidine kinase
MEAVSDVGKPALLAIEKGLVQKGLISERDKISDENKAQFDRLKQMLGAMVRQVLEGNGYQLHASNVKVPNSKVFYSASSYRCKSDT